METINRENIESSLSQVLDALAVLSRFGFDRAITSLAKYISDETLAEGIEVMNLDELDNPDLYIVRSGVLSVLVVKVDGSWVLLKEPNIEDNRDYSPAEAQNLAVYLNKEDKMPQAIVTRLNGVLKITEIENPNSDDAIDRVTALLAQ